MDNHHALRIIYFICLFINMAATILLVELVSRLIGKIRCLLQKGGERVARWVLSP